MKIKMEHQILIPAVSHEEIMAEFLGGNRLDLIREYGVPDQTFEIESSVFHSWILSEEITSSFSSSSSGNPFLNNKYSTNNRRKSGSSRSKVIEQIIELEFVDDTCVGSNSDNIDFAVAEHYGYDEEFYSDDIQRLMVKKEQRTFGYVGVGGFLLLVLILTSAP